MSIVDTITNILPKSNLQESVENSIVSSTGGVTYEDLMMKHTAKAAVLSDPNVVNDVEPGKWEALYDRATLQANTDLEGLGLFLYEAAVKDPNYNPLKDPIFQSLPADQQIELAPQVKDAATPDMLQGYINKANKASEIRTRAEQYGGLANFGADMVGSLFNVSNLFFARAALGELGVAATAAIRGGEAGALVLAQELGRQKTRRSGTTYRPS